MVVLSAYVAGPYLGELLEGVDGSVGYLLKERVGRVSDFLRSLDVVVSGGVVIGPEALAHLMHAGVRGASDVPGAAGAVSSVSAGPQLARLTPRETEVLALMAEGLSNGQIARRLVLSDGAVAKHVANIFLKLDLPPGEENRRVRAVLAWLRARA